MVGSALRFDQGKTRWGLMPTWALNEVAKVFTYGAEKYQTPRNWEKGMIWSKCFDSMKRHLHSYWSGEDVDPESGLFHLSHAACNVLFLLEYYRIFPQGDDRPLRHNMRVALDIDDVVASFAPSFMERSLQKRGIERGEGPEIAHHWHLFFDETVWEDLYKDKDFWVNLPAEEEGTGLCFEPVAYVTSRSIPIEWTKEWLQKHNFPAVPVHVTTSAKEKAEVLKSLNIDIFVDDKYENYVEINKAGIVTFLYSQPHNAKYNVGFKRIHKLNDLKPFLE